MERGKRQENLLLIIIKSFYSIRLEKLDISSRHVTLSLHSVKAAFLPIWFSVRHQSNLSFTSKVSGKRCFFWQKSNSVQVLLYFSEFFRVSNSPTTNPWKVFHFLFQLCLSASGRTFLFCFAWEGWQQQGRDEQCCGGWAVWGIRHGTMSVREKLRPQACQTTTC